jgi:UDP-N-acetyl-2-amino-2-deoxyglucuronate dehydrogenase
MDRVYGFALVGCGTIARTHVEAIAAVPRARLVAVCDVVEGRARQLAATAGAEATDLDQILERKDVDVVAVLVPSGLHASIGTRAAEAGKHVLVEKPIDVTLEAADRLIGTARRAGVKLGVISQHRFDPGMRQLREAVDSGRLGRLVLGDAIVKWYRTQQYYDSGDWRGTWALDGGGCLINQGIHSVDLLRWIMGPVERVFARCATAAHRIEVEDVALGLLRFANGALGVLEASTAVYPGMAERLEVTGTEGTMVVEAGQLTLCELRQGRDDPDYGRKLGRTDATGTAGSASPAIGSDAHRAQLADFVAAIDEDRDPLVDGEQGRNALELVLAVYESARSGREVELPLRTEG